MKPDRTDYMEGRHPGAGFPVSGGHFRIESEGDPLQDNYTGFFFRSDKVRKGSMICKGKKDSLMDLEPLPTNSDLMLDELMHVSSSKHKARRSLYLPSTTQDRPSTDIPKGKYLIRKRATDSCDIFLYGNLYSREISAVKQYKNKCKEVFDNR